MNVSEKDQRFLLFLLPVLVAALYGFFWLRPTLRTTAKLESGLNRMGSEQTILQRREQLNDEQNRLRKELAAVEAQAATNDASPRTVAEDSAASLRRLQDTFHRNGVRLIGATVDAQRGDAAQGDTIAGAMRKTGVLHPKSWTVTVEAPYDALLRLLDDCGTNRFSIVPETLSMRSGTGDSKTTYWTLKICL